VRRAGPFLARCRSPSTCRRRRAIEQQGTERLATVSCCARSISALPGSAALPEAPGRHGERAQGSRRARSAREPESRRRTSGSAISSV
jgi:hypothetical protein